MISRRLVLAVALIGGAAVGDATWNGAMQARSSSPPDGWRMEESRVPYRLTELSGPLRLSPEAWSLDFWRAIRPPGHGAEAIEASVLLPEGGRVELWPAADAGHQGEAGVGLVLERIGPPSSSVVQATDDGRRVVSCDVPLPPPTDQEIHTSITPTDQGVDAEVLGVTAHCPVTARGLGPVIRPGLRRVQLRDLRVGELTVAPPGPPLRPLWALTGALAVLALVLLELARLPVQPVLWTTAPLLLALALDGRDLRLWAETARMSMVPSTWLGAGVPLLLAGLGRVIWHLGRSLHEARRVGSGRDWPLSAVLTAGLPVVVGTLELPAAGPTALLALATVGGVGGLGVGLIFTLRRLGSARPRRTAAWCVGMGSLLGLLVVLTRPTSQDAITGAVVAGTALTALIWANANTARVRWLNLASLLFVTLGLGGVELVLRNTPMGQAWSGGGSRVQPDDIYGWVSTANAGFEAIEDGTPSSYPSSGNPVAVAAEDGRPRLVAMGGSTTGGAFQNDDLSQFYPARLDELLGGRVQVLNQGVGGWTTWHIRRYLERNLAALHPDVLTLYVGHNDVLTPVPAPYSRLYAAWSQPSRLRGVIGALERLRLFQGFRYLVVSFRPPGDRVAVPLEEARENLASIVKMATDAGAGVILASEGLAPDPGPLLPYDQMMRELAADHAGVVYVDAAEALHAADDGTLFLDDCHLSDRGHRLVAGLLRDALLEAGMIPEADGS